jgi:hypothetical protein
VTATPDIPAQQDRAAVERDYLLGVLIDREVAQRVENRVKHRLPVTPADRDTFEQEARRRIAAAAREAAEAPTVDYFVALAREEL